MSIRSTCLAKTLPNMSRKPAREFNLKAAAIPNSKLDKFGFFTALRDILNTEAAFAEIKYALDDPKADGVTLFTATDLAITTSAILTSSPSGKCWTVAEPLCSSTPLTLKTQRG